VTVYYACAKSVVGGKCLPMENLHAVVQEFSTDSARKRNKMEVLANYIKTRINTGHLHDRWTELKEAFRVQTQVYKVCHCALSSEIGRCIINDAWRQAAHRNKENTRFFLSNLVKCLFILMFWRYTLTFNAKNNFQANYQTYRHYPFHFNCLERYVSFGLERDNCIQ